MNVTEFRSQVQPGATLYVGEQQFTIDQVVTFRMEDGSSYVKCFLNDDYIFADDLAQNIFYLVSKVDVPVTQPFPQKISFDGKEFDFLYDARATAEEVSGKEIYKKGQSEQFWDYQAGDDSYLSLGIEDATDGRWDCCGRIVQPEEVTLTLV
ncbi:MAG: hypothetical protein COV10_03360 [Candidatus Vogelbacteria bacterium CG10_big_fil_rev_8_21_14_0_10_51_16]|uniref:DUF4178 domain-containing protein n=1 Tax=Candidatus Vogelbacteria bacterium CG10_big_fil_rev_8_21_14_0_10_51_16 TaxID=1975045 RepID=A0A2H0RFY4_9BACT|nr:MAG: hypothetical protein COV10_03360 [Candidatus Vogelbacteria bacterium CG10_big_fil_rev_8_21_14_0_10_51_16]